MYLATEVGLYVGAIDMRTREHSDGWAGIDCWLGVTTVQICISI